MRLTLFSPPSLSAVSSDESDDHADNDGGEAATVHTLSAHVNVRGNITCDDYGEAEQLAVKMALAAIWHVNMSAFSAMTCTDRSNVHHSYSYGSYSYSYDSTYSYSFLVGELSCGMRVEVRPRPAMCD